MTHRSASFPVAAAGLCVLCGVLTTLVGCPDNSQPTCGPAATPSSLTLSFSPQPSSKDCKVRLADGGPSDGGLGQLPPPVLATFCATTLADGGVTVSLVVSGKKATADAPLDLDGGQFTFKSDPVDVQNTACRCLLRNVETIQGHLNLVDGGVPRLTDGGIAAKAGLTADLTDALDAPVKTDCLCDTPCELHYTLTGAAPGGSTP